MIRPTLELGNPQLREAAGLVADPTDPALEALLEDMRDTLHDFQQRMGWGSAMSAPMIGVPLRVVLVERDEVSMVLINPRFERWSSQGDEAYESCIAFPDLWGCVYRPKEVVVLATDQTGAEQRWELQDALARLVQHEIDHLDGLTWLDRDPDLTKLATATEYERRYREE